MAPETKKGHINTILILKQLLRGRREDQLRQQVQQKNVDLFIQAKQNLAAWGLLGYGERPFPQFIQSVKGQIFFYAPEFEGPIVDAYPWHTNYVAKSQERVLFYQSGVPHHKDTGVWPLSGTLILHAVWPHPTKPTIYEVAIKTSFDPSFSLTIASAVGVTTITENDWARTHYYPRNARVHLDILQQHLSNPFSYRTDFSKIERDPHDLNTNRVNALFKITRTSQQLALPK